ncbi:hypothetical protein B1T45_01770 [Mycobacterium kansasii]|nr:hypothetical protein B1T43_01765 [Mycobacterium kansasii]ETZ98181.1 putative membrane protein [Mycobacterium kansasii 824]ARG60251.1 hypothetical protein B1T45_01770 [Mycobacterium kansasii]ARG67985.1 hypothetical protein B1T47_01865 [Mycobacterium kansasii]ARG77500.1 hypothetical protein B1T51_26955 [Mycobacterium kansasii]
MNRASGRVGTWFSTTTWGSALWQRVLAAVIAAVIFWPQPSVDPSVGLDPSWQAGLALARIDHIAWGRELVFTYGPLGFLRTSAYYSFEQSLLATICQVIIIAALFLGIAAALRLRHSPLTSLVGAFVLTGILTVLHLGHGLAFRGSSSLEMMYPELAVLAAFVWASVPLLQREPKRSTVFTTCVALGAVAGFQLLMKFNTGLAIMVVALATSVLLGWKAVGRHCATVAAFAVSTLVSWVLAGQRPGNLPAWLRGSAAIASGYTDGMATAPLPQWALPSVVLSLAWMGWLCVMFLRRGHEIPRRYLALVVLASLIAGKAAFGRFEPWHFAILVGVIVVALAITPWPRARRRTLVVVALAVALVVVVDLGGIPALSDRGVLAMQAPVQAVDRIVTFALPGHVQQKIEQAKARQRALYGIPDRFIKTIGSSTVHVDPHEISAVWAYDLAWRPTLVFQTYQALTPMLDALNGESLTNGPEFVLSRLSPALPAVGIDGRLGVQESPLYSRALLCNYTLSGIENRWALFKHTAPHCGPLTKLSEAPVREDHAVPIPAPSAPDKAVLVGIDLDQTFGDRYFHGKIAPLSTFTLVVDGVTYRLIAKNAAEPFLVNTPASAADTNLQIHAHSIGVGRTVNLNEPSVTARLRFYEMRVGP